MPAPQTYRGTITREQFLSREVRAVARLMHSENLEDASGIVERVVKENLFQYPTERDLASIARACHRRIMSVTSDPALHDKVLELLAEGTTGQLDQANLYCMMCDNRLVWDFMVCVIGAKNQRFETGLTAGQIAAFIEGLRAQSADVNRWSDATRNKVRQVLTRCIVDCGMYNRKEGALTPFRADIELEDLIRANNDACVLPAFGILEQ